MLKRKPKIRQYQPEEGPVPELLVIISEERVDEDKDNRIVAAVA
jgi:hypothetical protein